MNAETLHTTVYAVVERALLEQVDLDSLGMTRLEPDAAIVDDLGVDSVDFLTAVYDIEVELKVKLPINEWLAEQSATGGRGGFTVAALVSKLVELLQQTQATRAEAV